jgi:hypothetical protein
MATNSRVGFNESENPDKYYATFQVERNGVNEQINKAVFVDSEGNEMPLAQDGTDATGVSPISGGTGIRGWLSSIFKTLSDRLPSLIEGKIPVSLGSDNITITGSVTIPGEIEIANDTGNPIPVNVLNIGGHAVGGEGLKVRTRENLTIANKFYVGNINPTIGTPVALGVAAQNAFAPLAPNIIISATTKQIVLCRLLLSVGVAGTGLSSLRMAVRVSTTNKYSSGGTLVNMASTPLRNASTALVRVGGPVPIVALAEQSDTQRVFNGTVKNAIPIVSEQINFEIGNEHVSDFQTPGRILLRIPPVVIPPGGCAMFNIWGPGQTAAPTYEGILYYVEE